MTETHAHVFISIYMGKDTSTQTGQTNERHRKEQGETTYVYNCAQISSQMSRSTHTGILPCVRALMTTHSYTSMTYRTQRHVCAHMSICILLTQAHTCTNTYLERLSPLVLHVYICAVTQGEEQSVFLYLFQVPGILSAG